MVKQMIMVSVCTLAYFEVEARVHKDGCLFKTEQALVTNVFEFTDDYKSADEIRHEFILEKDETVIFRFNSCVGGPTSTKKVWTGRGSPVYNLPEYDNYIDFKMPKCCSVGRLKAKKLSVMEHGCDKYGTFKIATVSDPKHEHFQIIAITSSRTGTYGLKKGKMEKLKNFDFPKPKEGEVSMTEFVVNKMFWVNKFRVKAQMYDNYYGDFSGGRDKLYSFRLEAKADEAENTLHGYVLRDSALGKKMFEKLKNGKAQECVVSVRCVPKSYSGTDVVIEDCEFVGTRVE